MNYAMPFINKYVKEIAQDAQNGDKTAIDIMSLGTMYNKYPDTGCKALLEASFEDWYKRKYKEY